MIEVYSPLILKNNSSNACGRDREGAKCDQMLRAGLASHASATEGLDTPSSPPQCAACALSTSLARAYEGHISLAILANGHRPYNILINLFDTQCNLFIRVEVARHILVPRAVSPPSSRIYIHNRHIYIAVPTYRIQTQNQLFAHLYTQDVCIETLRRKNQFVSLNY